MPAPTDTSHPWLDAVQALRPVPVDPVGPGPRTDLVLQFELRELIPRTAYRWNGPTSRSVRAAGPRRTGPSAAGDDVGSGEFRLGVHPAVRTAKGCSRADVTWSSVAHRRHRLDLDPAQQRWFCEFAALHRAAVPAAPGQDAAWLFVDEFANPLLWALLAQGAQLGVAFVGPTAAAHVHVARAARLTLDAAATADGLHLAPRLEIDGAPAAVAHARAVGDHGVHVVDPARPGEIVLAPLAEPLDDATHRLLGPRGVARATVHVPAGHQGAFLRDHLPGLVDDLPLASADGSVTVPAAPAPRLALTVTPGARATLALRWHWHRTARRGGPAPALAAVLPRTLPPGPWLAAVVPPQPSDAPGAGPARTPGGVRGGGAGPDVPGPDVPGPDLSGPDLPGPDVPGLDLPGALPPAVTLRGVDVAEFVAAVLPRLRRAGVDVTVDGTLPDHRELTGVPRLQVSVVPGERPDWFDLAVTVTVDGREIPFAPLFRALASGRTRIMLPDKTFLRLNHPALLELAACIAEAHDLAEWSPGPVLGPHQVGLWREIEALADVADADPVWLARTAELARAAPAPVPVPHGLHAQLRPHQHDGFAWLVHRWRHGVGGVLADDMGLGKTLQVLALVQHRAELRGGGAGGAGGAGGGGDEGGAGGAGGASGVGGVPHGPFLVVAPTSVVPVWAAEAARFTPGLVVRTATATEGAGGTAVADLAAGADLVVTSYALLRRDAEAYRAVGRVRGKGADDDPAERDRREDPDRGAGWAGLVLDEAQAVKNAASQVHACVRDLGVRFTLAVTGTPLENSLLDLHALMALVAPGLLPGERRFRDEYVLPVQAVPAGVASGPGAGDGPDALAAARARAIARLRRRTDPFVLRRTKDEVAPDLPAKQGRVLAVDLDPEHRLLYDQYLHREREKLLGLAGGVDRNRFTVFRSLTLLRLLALDASLVDEAHAAVPSAKLDALVTLLTGTAAQGRRALVFSQFTSYLRRAAARLDAVGLRHVHLDGATVDRARTVARFREGDAPVFLISLRAGGSGLTLTEADDVVLLDPWWNPAVEAQAVDRAHRIGRDRPLQVHRIVATGTIEEKVMALQRRKAALFDAVVEGAAPTGPGLSDDDVAGLLG